VNRLAVLVAFVALYAAQKDVPIITATLSDRPPKSDEFQGCSLGCALAWNITATSAHKNNGSNEHDAKKLDDFDLSTAWIEGKDGFGIGESVTFHFTKELWESDLSHPDKHSRDKVNFNGFRILNGYAKSEILWMENSRVKQCRVYHNDKPIFDIALADSMHVQTAECETVWLRPDDTIRVEIMEVYPGDKYKDTAITELTPEGAH